MHSLCKREFCFRYCFRHTHDMAANAPQAFGAIPPRKQDFLNCKSTRSNCTVSCEEAPICTWCDAGYNPTAQPKQPERLGTQTSKDRRIFSWHNTVMLMCAYMRTSTGHCSVSRCSRKMKRWQNWRVLSAVMFSCIGLTGSARCQHSHVLLMKTRLWQGSSPWLHTSLRHTMRSWAARTTPSVRNIHTSQSQDPRQSFQEKLHKGLCDSCAIDACTALPVSRFTDEYPWDFKKNSFEKKTAQQIFFNKNHQLSILSLLSLLCVS